MPNPAFYGPWPRGLGLKCTDKGYQGKGKTFKSILIKDIRVKKHRKWRKMVSRIKGKGGYSYRQRDSQVRKEEIEIGERMMLVSDRMRKEVLVLLENIDSRRGVSTEELRDVIKKGLKVVVEAVEETMTGISDTLTNERKERKEEEERTGDRLRKVEEKEGSKEDRMRKMEERIDEKESKAVERVRKVEDRLQEVMLDMEDRTKNVEEKVLEIEMRV